MEKIVALGADYCYIRQVETTIKSLIYNNYGVQIYLINSDIPSDWFEIINKKINPLGSQIIDKKYNPDLLSTEHNSWPHISVASYARFFIPEMIRNNKVIYLDSDIIVNKNLDQLFNLNFEENEMLAAVKDFGEDNYFNDGVVVFNNQELRKIHGLTSILLKLGQNNKLTNGDQSVINDYFSGHIKELPDKYNYGIGLEKYVQARPNVLSRFKKVREPFIIHYCGGDKPWNRFSSGHLRLAWWRFYDMDWTTIAQHTIYKNSNINKIHTHHFVGNLLTLTNDQNLENLEELVKALPEWRFHIGAYTSMAYDLSKMSQYPNVKLYPQILGYQTDELLKTCDCYLDINHGNKFDDYIERFTETGKPILTFNCVKSQQQGGDNYFVFKDDEISKMVHFLQQIN